MRSVGLCGGCAAAALRNLRAGVSGEIITGASRLSPRPLPPPPAFPPSALCCSHIQSYNWDWRLISWRQSRSFGTVGRGLPQLLDPA